nr:structural protein [Tolivirales sp.]
MVRKQTRNRRPKGQRANARKPRGPRNGGRYNTPAAYAVKGSKPQEANMVLRNEELWATVSGGPVLYVQTFLPGTSGLPILDAEAQRFDLYRIRSAKLMYKPNVGTTEAGRTVIAVDYDATQPPASVAALNSIQPQVRPQVFEPAEMRVDPSRANKQTWLRTLNAGLTVTAAFSACYNSTATASTSVGELWISYEVEFTNPRVASTSMVVGAGFPLSTGGLAHTDYTTSGKLGIGAPAAPELANTPFGTYLESAASGLETRLMFWARTVGRYFVAAGTFADIAQRDAFVDNWEAFFTTRGVQFIRALWSPSNTAMIGWIVNITRDAFTSPNNYFSTTLANAALNSAVFVFQLIGGEAPIEGDALIDRPLERPETDLLVARLRALGVQMAFAPVDDDSDDESVIVVKKGTSKR